jgi:hypothetical protein
VAVFGGAGVMLLIAGYALWKQRNAPCPADPVLGRYCTRLRKLSVGVYAFAVTCYLVGAFFAFLAVRLFA